MANCRSLRSRRCQRRQSQRWRNVDNCNGRFEAWVAHGNLSLASEINRLPKNTSRLLRCMEASRVLGFDEVEIELCAALQIQRRLEIVVGLSRGLGCLQVVDQSYESGHRILTQFPVPILYFLNAI